MNQESDPNTDVERVDLQSLDVGEQKRQELLRLFPEVRTEGGRIDFDRLKLTLGAAVDVGKERYGLTWPGKAECFRTIQTPSSATLRPMRDDSVNFDTTENLIIEGDNLEVLKLLQKAYLGKVKMIYIDPPYNTGNDFIYPDNYTESLQTYLQYTGQVDAEGKKFSTNTEADGRFHSKWLNMMYPRIFLAYNLLREDGVICVSVDDNEAHHLRLLLNEVFGEENLVAAVVWQKRDTPANDAKGLSVTHEYILVYQRSEAFGRNLLPRSDEQIENYKNPDNDPRGPWTRTSLIRKEVRPDRLYEVKNRAGRVRVPPPGTSWRVAPERFAEYEEDNKVWWGLDGDGDLPFLNPIDHLSW